MTSCYVPINCHIYRTATTSDNILRVTVALGGRVAWIYVGRGRRTCRAGLTHRPLRVMNTYFALFEHL